MDRSGEKHPLGLREGATENTATCKGVIIAAHRSDRRNASEPYPIPRRKEQRSRYWFVLQTRGWPNSIPSVNESLISDYGFRKHSLGYQVPRQTGLRFSRKAQIPSWASAAIAFRLITSFV